MMTKAKLSSEDGAFFELVARAAFCNPFGEERIELDRRIAECPANIPVEERIRRSTEKVRQRILGLEQRNEANLHLYSGEDRRKLQFGFLFDIYYRLSDQINRLILDQVEFGREPCRVPFAEEALALFSQRGFDRHEACRYFAIFYQIRRAFYFINQNLIGSSPSMQRLRLHLWNNIFTHDIALYERHMWNRMEDFSTLLLGETGSGKGTAAAAIGRSCYIPFDENKRCFVESFTRNFIAINLSQFAELLIESELFGHRKGAFTGAIDHHQGIFSRCTQHGSIFLDEIGEISIPVQVKLLQVIQDRTFTPVGSHEQLRFSGRVIAAANRPLEDLLQKGLLRKDLFYRLCSDVIVVPPLRLRLKEDPVEIEGMLSHIIHRIIGEKSETLVRMVRDVIEGELGPDYPWPGNVRELEQAVRRILLTKRFKIEQEIPAATSPGNSFFNPDSHEPTAQEMLMQYCSTLYDRHGSYEEVSRRTRLDRRTAKKYIDLWQKKEQH